MNPWKPAAILNPRAGRGRAPARWRRWRPLLERRYGPIETHETSAPGEAFDLARRLRGAGCNLLFVAGGDGSLNEIANGLLADGAPASSVTLAPLPAGKGSDFVRALGASNEPRMVDAVRASFPGARDRWFVNMASFGLGAEVVRRCGGHRSAGYLMAAVATLARYHARHVRMAIDAQEVECRAVHVALGNGPSQGRGMRVCPRALPDDGLIDVTVIGDVGLADLAANLHLVYSGRIYEHPKVCHFRGTHVAIVGDAAIEMDGDPAGFLPAEFTVVPAALSILNPDLDCIA